MWFDLRDDWKGKRLKQSLWYSPWVGKCPGLHFFLHRQSPLISGDSFTNYPTPIFDGKRMQSALWSTAFPGGMSVIRSVTSPYLFTGKEWQRKRSSQKGGKVNQFSLSCYQVCLYKEKSERHFERASKIVVFLFTLVLRLSIFLMVVKLKKKTCFLHLLPITCFCLSVCFC